MARRPNYMYRGTGPWGPMISTLGSALFGDPEAIAARERGAADTAYRKAQTESSMFELEQSRKAAANQERHNAAIMGRLGLGDLFSPPGVGVEAPTPGAEPVGAAPLSHAAAAPSPMSLDELITGERPGPSPARAASVPAAPGPAVSAAAPPAPVASSPLAEVFSGAMPPGYADVVARMESGGDPRARTTQPGQTAAGLYGFTDPTWQGLGMQGSAAEAPPEMQTEALNRLAESNAGILAEDLGRQPTMPEILTAHRFGAGKTRELLAADPATPMDQLISPEVMAVNPDLQGKTVGEVLGVHQQAFGGDPGIAPLAAVPPDSTGGGAAAPAIAEATDPTAAAFAPSPEAAPQGQASLFDDLTDNEKTQIALEIAQGGSGLEALQNVMAAKAKEGQWILKDVPGGKVLYNPSNGDYKAVPKAMNAGGEGGGPFGGSGLETSLMNTVHSYQTKLARGEQPTPEDRYAYELALSKLEEPRYYQGSDGRQRVVRFAVPTMGGAPQREELVETAPGTGVMEPAAVPDVASAPIPGADATEPAPDATTPAPGATTESVGGAEITTIPGEGKPFPAETGGRVGALEAGVPDYKIAMDIFMPPDESGQRSAVDQRAVMEAFTWGGYVPSGAPRSEGSRARLALLRAIEPVFRVLTGAAAPEQESKRLLGMFQPSPLDNEAAQRDKLNALGRWMSTLYEFMHQGRGATEKAKFTVEQLDELAAQALAASATPLEAETEDPEVQKYLETYAPE